MAVSFDSHVYGRVSISGTLSRFAERKKSAFPRELPRSRRACNVQRVEKVGITCDHVVAKASRSCKQENHLKSELVRNLMHLVPFQRKLRRINYETVAQAAMQIKFSEGAHSFGRLSE